MVVTWTGPALRAAAPVVPLALFVRPLSLTPALLMHMGHSGKSNAPVILTWAGLRGGIAVTLTDPPTQGSLAGGGVELAPLRPHLEWQQLAASRPPLWTAP